MNRKIGSSITTSVLLSILLIGIFLTDTIMAEETVSGTQDDTLGVWMFSAGTTVPAGAPTDDIIERAVFYNILDYIGDTAEEVYSFGYGPSEPVPGHEDKTLAKVIEGLSAIDDFGLLADAGDDEANFDTGRRGYFLGGFDPATIYKIHPDGKPAIGLLGPSGAPTKEDAEKALDGCELFIFEDAELSGMIITLSNKLGLSITITIKDLQINPPTPAGADDTLIAIDLDTLAGFDGTFIDTIRIQDDGITSPSTYGDTTLEIDAIAIRKSMEKPSTGSIGDTVWLDENRNGVQEVGERGVPGVTVILKGLISTTRENGYYLFENLTAGTYTAQVMVPNGYEATTVTSYLIDLGIGEDYLDADFGIAPPPPAKLIIEKFNDTDGNGIFSTGIDEMLTGWKVDVMNPDGVTTSYFTPISLDITNFGTYTLTEDLPSDWEQTAVQVDGVYILPPTREVKVAIGAGETHDVLYGNWKPAPLPAKLIVEKFNDLNSNGVFDGDDVMISDWEIYVTDPAGVTATYHTPLSLNITLFGTYIINENLPLGWEQTAVRIDGVYADPPTLTMPVEINVGEGHSVLYGNRRAHEPHPAKLVIEKFNDTNGNGIYDVGVDIMVTSWQIHVIDPDGLTTSYLTPKVLDITKFGTYTVTEDLPDDWKQTAARIDGIYKSPPTVQVTILINEGETHHVLYGNKVRMPPPPPPSIGISLYIRPISVYIPSAVNFRWTVESPPKVTPDYAELYLRNPDGVIIPLATYTVFPPWTGSYTWISTPPAGAWRVYIVYHYEYLGREYTVSAYGRFIVRTPLN